MNNLLDWYREFLKIMEDYTSTGKINLSNFTFIDPELLILLSPELIDEKTGYIKPLNTTCNEYVDFTLKNYNKIINTSKYIPIFTLNNENFDSFISKTYEILNVNFNIINENLIKYIIGELYDNINQHSDSIHNYNIIQHYDKLGLEICIYDDGIGIPNNFRKNGIEFKSDINALELALEGWSTKDDNERGHGLSTINSIMNDRTDDEFIIISNKGIYHYFKGHKKLYQLLDKQKFNGTLISIIFKSTKDINIYNYTG